MTDQPTSDTERFDHAGLECKILQTDLGHWCGYVRIPDDLGPVRWTSDYNSKHDEVIEAEVDVWGGITYGPDDDGWVGFDDAHSRDLADYILGGDASDREAVKAETKDLAEQIRSLQPGSGQSAGGEP